MSQYSLKFLSKATVEFSSFSGVFTISNAVDSTISLLLTDEGRFPQERKSGVALWRLADGATGQ